MRARAVSQLCCNVAYDDNKVLFYCQITGPCGYVPKGVCVAQQTGRTVKCFTTSSELPSASSTRGQKITTPSRLLRALSRFERLKDMNERVI